MAVHNHGSEEGSGLSCREVLVNGELKGECLRTGMADDLRTRIANDCCSGYGLKEHERFDIADAVIRELGLQPHLAKRIINGKPDQWVRRHVTDWEIVDD